MVKPAQKVDLDRISGTRRSTGPIVRDLSRPTYESAPVTTRGRAFGNGWTWLVVTLANLALLLVVAFAAVVGPPVLECRERAKTGFFTGQTLMGCVDEATRRRMEHLENWIGTVLRGSGR
ncbi:hypothetical protein [Methylobacterium gossipiicola]|uniref:Uncharacterized protein n=1 Tax=Methylobacterium gossipiicola TaxID=582675 RepID=A0A1I2QSS2_9HYPH|nr:hypothetical protein [Methylobacterium gossipiicola]SFG28696.1 hypothetical protein SAMN05192565_101202 [Methylobacterium gossipiicola]